MQKVGATKVRSVIVVLPLQNTLSLLSRSIIQQFLDELVWRERWGPIPSKAFDSLIAHTAELTKLETGNIIVLYGRYTYSQLCYSTQNCRIESIYGSSQP